MPALLAMRFAPRAAIARQIERAMWEGVDKTLLALGAASPTSALSKGFDSRVDTIDGFLDAFKLEPATDLSRRIERPKCVRA